MSADEMSEKGSVEERQTHRGLAGKMEDEEVEEPARRDAWPDPADDIETTRRIPVKDEEYAVPEKARSQPSILSRTLSRHSTTTNPPINPDPPPDGGLLAWTQVVMLHLTTFSTFGYTTSFGSFQTYYESSLHIPPSTISWLGSLQLFLLFFIGTFSGRALDAGYFRHVYIAGCAMQLLGIFTTSAATRYWQLVLSQGVCMGIANGLHYAPTYGLVATYFAKKRALVFGLGAMGSCTGGVVFPVIVQQLLPKIGFAWTVRVIGFIMLASNIVTVSFYKTRLPPRRTGPIVEWAAFKEPPYVLYCCASFFFFWGLYFTFFYIGSYGVDRLGMSYQDSINLLLTTVSVGFLWRLLPNYFADHLGPVNIIVPFTFLCSIMMFGWTGVRTPAALYVFAAIYGCGSAGIQSMYPATLASLTGDLSKAGVRMGMGFTLVSFACLTGAPLAGALIQKGGGNYIYAQIWGGLTFALGGLFLLAARTAKVGWKLKVRI